VRDKRRRALESTLFWESARGVPRSDVKRAVKQLDKEAADSIADAEDVLGAVTADLAKLLHEFDPVPIIGLIAYLSRLSVTVDTDAYARFGTEAKIQFLAGVALSTSTRPRKAPGPAQIQEVIDLTADIFDLEIAVFRHGAGGGEDHIEQARVQLRLEALLDRFQGYLVHLRQILSGVFEPMRSLCESTLGWCPADVSELARSVRTLVQDRLDEFHPPIHRRLNAGPPPDDKVLLAASDEQAEFAARLFVVTPQELSEVSLLDEEVLRDALASLATRWGDQSDFLRPTQPNHARRYNVIDLGEDRFFVPLSQELINEVYSWFLEEVRSRGLRKVEAVYLRTRDGATEQISRRVLGDIFGANRVLGPLYYPSNGETVEVDGVVTVAEDALVVECKAHTLTDPGRRGAPDRVRKKFGELVEAPFRQSQRCVDYLIAGGNAFRDSRDVPQSIEIREHAKLPRVAVSFERIDPLAAHVPRHAVAEGGTAAWLISLADLMMVGDILSDPASFWSYTMMRQRISNEPRSLVVAEPDLLGLYLDDRCHQMIGILESQPAVAVAVGPGADELNSYFAKVALGNPADPPSTSIPPAVLSALKEALHQGKEGWTDLAETVLEQPSSTWRKWSGAERKVRRALRNKGQGFRVVDADRPPLRLVCCTSGVEESSLRAALEEAGTPALLVTL
jgi:hypothetical protein